MNLYPHQVRNAAKLVRAVTQRGAALDVSDTGTGKSFTAFAVAAALRRNLFVVCPKGVGSSWIHKYQQVQTGGAGIEWVNYEIARRPSFFEDRSLDRSLLVFDEAHRVGAPNSQQAKMVRRIADRGVPILFLSATPFATPLRTRAFLHATGAVRWDRWYSVLPELGCYRNRSLRGRPWQFTRSTNKAEAAMRHLRTMLEDCMVGTRWSEVSGFPDRVVQPEAVQVEDSALAATLARTAASNPLAQTVKERQALEGLRVSAMVEMARDLVAQQQHVLVFFNFTAPLHEFGRAAGAPIIDGSTPPEEREQLRARFQRGELPVLALNAKAGGEGIDLHGERRVSLVSPDYSATTWVQVMGRTHRVGGGRAIIRPVFIAGTIEETRILPAVTRKVQHLETLTDHDFLAHRN